VYTVLFNLYVQEAINKIREEIEVGIRINGEKVGMLRFSANIAAITENKKNLQNILEILNLTMNIEYNVKISESKT